MAGQTAIWQNRWMLMFELVWRFLAELMTTVVVGCERNGVCRKVCCRFAVVVADDASTLSALGRHRHLNPDKSAPSGRSGDSPHLMRPVARIF